MNYRSLLEKVAKDKSLKVIYDSRKVSKGDIFVCIKGFKIDSHNYADEVVSRGAKYIVSQRDMQLPPEVELILVDDTRKALAELSSAHFNNPSAEMNICGITGTNGKTTTSYMIEKIMKRAGLNTGLIGTIEMKIGEESIKTKNTTPESFELQDIFNTMIQRGINSVAMEVSSHALSLYRVWNCYFTGVIYTNFSQDHLDFHRNLQDYWETKAGFLDLQKEFKHRDGIFSVFNGDDPEVIKLLPRGNGRRFVYSAGNQHFKYDKDIELIVARDIKLSGHGTGFNIIWDNKTWEFNLKLMGMFNIYNCLASICGALGLNIEMPLIIEALESMEPVKGRICPVNRGQNFTCLVDYAHTPDGLEKILRAAKEFTKGRVLTVFGCGGDRDKSKRPIMGRIGADFSDYLIITSDNPRTEEPLSIIRDIENGLREINFNNYLIEEDRKAAIEKALSMAKEGDCVVVAGKGHEDYQIFKNETIHFDDGEIIAEYLEKISRK